MTAAPEILSVLASSNLPIEAQAFASSVIEGETPQIIKAVNGYTCSPWNILYSGAGSLVGTAGLENPADANYIVSIGKLRYWDGSFDSTGFPAWSGGRLANGNFSTAYGGLQITRTTFRGNSGFGITSLANPVKQAIFGWKLAQQQFAARYPSKPLLTVLQGGTNADLQLVHILLGLTPGGSPGGVWPGGCDSGFAKRYIANLIALQNPAPISTPHDRLSNL